MKEVKKWGWERGSEITGEWKRIEIAWPLVWRRLGSMWQVRGGPEDDGRMVVEGCRRRGMKVNAGKIKVMVLKGEKGLECEAHVDGIHLNISKFKYLGYALDKLGRAGAECSRKVVSERRVAGAIRSLVNSRNLHLRCARVLHETLFLNIFMYGSDTMFWKQKERSRIRAIRMDNLKGLLGIRRMDRFPNAEIRELCRVKKGLDERIN